MENRNPYSSPRAKVADAGTGSGQEYGEIRVFSAQGRLGRIRYIGYSVGLALLMVAVGMGLSAGISAVGQEAVGVALAVVTYVAVYVVTFLLTIQRAHDFDTTGWISVLLLVPLVSLIFWFIPGTKGENRFGPPPPPNTGGAIALACILPVIFFIGILAAIAIPAYQDYVERVRQSQSQPQ